ncbi:MAG TPA: DUF2442 domain-containing protein [Syntrophobacteraceae bacterium]|nr:DUF2442 domain-containing protein [Syntrophobacteraceae bacterium]HBD10275.1 DUF2442 domain-containing protein [Syntrophobacteraceae bacterium]HBZ55253.1 DUF2442 domain-containing protein [Syntrophobacteraceae bacterium]
MYVDIVSATYLEGYKIELVFENGKSGVVDFTKYVQRGGIFARLEDLESFRRFRIDQELGVIVWEGGIDIAPEVLYSEATEEPLPYWMEVQAEMKRSA